MLVKLGTSSVSIFTRGTTDNSRRKYDPAAFDDYLALPDERDDNSLWSHNLELQSTSERAASAFYFTGRFG